MPSMPRKQKQQQGDVPELLALCRAERRLTLAKVSDEVGLTKGALSKIERRKIRMARTTQIRLAAFLRKYGYYPKEAA
jgi:transcriptional regulator with XRE-family HTH domain